jgi:predicted dienelactone hydrolase
MKFFKLSSLFLFLISGWILPLAGNITPEKIGTTTIPFYDALRQRPLITEIWFPVDHSAKAFPVISFWKLAPEVRDVPFVCKNKKLPLILMSHGDSGSRMDNAWLGEYLADHGYLVASVDHYGSTWYLYHPREAVRTWERPKDISYVIEQMLNDPVFGPCINPDKVGFVGFSLGGLTGIWLAGGQANEYQIPSKVSIAPFHLAETSDPDLIRSIDFSKAKKVYKDSRIKAAFLMAPAHGEWFSKVGLDSINIPLYIVDGAGDTVTPPEKNAKYLASSIASAKLEIIPGQAGHFVFLNEFGQLSKMIPSRFIEDESGVNRKQIHEELAKKALDFFNQTLNP